MRLTSKLIALFAVIFLVLSPMFHVADAQIPPELLGCYNSLVGGGTGDPGECCISDIIDGFTALIGLPIVGDLVNAILDPLLSLCCLGDITGLELSCCVGALIFTPGSPILDTCCGVDVILNNDAECCLSGAGIADLCVCLDPDLIGQNAGECCTIPDYDANLFEVCCATPDYGVVQVNQCCNQPSFEGTAGTEIENCCGTAADITSFPACCGLTAFPDATIDLFLEGCCASAADYVDRAACCATETFNADQITNCCSEALITGREEACCNTYYADLADPTVCTEFLTAECTAAAQGGAAAPGPDFNAAVCCNNPDLPSAGTAWEFDCLYLECEATFVEATCCVPELATAPFADQCPAPTDCATDFDVDLCCSATAIVDNEAVCCAAGPVAGGVYALPSQIATCCAAGAAFDANVERCCSAELTVDLADSTQAQCCTAALIEANSGFCCTLFFDDYTAECNAILAAQCTANANGGTAPPSPDFDAAACCNNPNLPSAGTAWEFDCLWLQCETTFDAAVCCVPELATAPFADQCAPPSDCEVNFDVNLCCSATAIVDNEAVCCSAGPVAGGVYALPTQIETCCAAGASFDANVARCCSADLTADLAASTQAQCCTADLLETNSGFCCTLFFDDYAVECNAILAAQCTAAANGGAAPPGPDFDAAACCNNPNLPSAGTAWEFDCLYLQCVATFDATVCCVPQLSTAPFASQCDAPTPGCRSSVLNLQRLNITNINSRGDTNIGILNNPGRRPRAARLRQVREGTEEL